MIHYLGITNNQNFYCRSFMKQQEPLYAKLFQLPRNIRGGDLRESIQVLSRLSLNQLLLLQCLYELNRDNPMGIPLKTLAAQLKVTPATASEMVDTLVRREIVERRHSESDRRAIAIRLQRNWQALFSAHEKEYMRRVEAFFATRTLAERETFENMVDDLNEFLIELPLEGKMKTGDISK